VSTLPLLLVLASAVLHATWNLLAKRAATGVGFVWSFSLVTVLLYGPVALVVVLREPGLFRVEHVPLAFVTALLHIGYFSALQRGYRAGDLSLVYPLARGSGPALATLLAVLFLAERPGLQALLGTALIVTSVFVLTGGPRRRDASRRAAVGYGLLTGLFIALYTVWDGYAVAGAGASPLPYLVMAELFRTLLMTPLALRQREALRATWRAHRSEVLGVAILSPLAYVLVLTALQHAPVSLVAPLREISILFATLLGARALSEGEGARRSLAAAAMVLGAALLATA
jgi:drug/metabolite transporter (DMT)-like permease